MEEIVAAYQQEERKLSFLDELRQVVQVAEGKGKSAAQATARNNLQQVGEALRSYAQQTTPLGPGNAPTSKGRPSRFRPRSGDWRSRKPRPRGPTAGRPTTSRRNRGPRRHLGPRPRRSRSRPRAAPGTGAGRRQTAQALAGPVGPAVWQPLGATRRVAPASRRAPRKAQGGNRRTGGVGRRKQN